MSYVPQNVLPSKDSHLYVHQFDDSDIQELMYALRETALYLGISLQVSVEGRVEAVALATTNEAFYIKLEDSARGEVATATGRVPSKSVARTATTLDITTTITTRLDVVLAGFSMARIALHLHRVQGWHVNGVDLSSLLVSTGERPMYPSDFVERKVASNANRRQIDALWYPDSWEEDEDQAMRKVCLRAWISALCANTERHLVQSAKRIDTARGGLHSSHLLCLENMMFCAELLENQKPIRIENDFSEIFSAGGDSLQLANTRYKTRVRQSNRTTVEFHTESGTSMLGRASAAKGKMTEVKLVQGQYRDDITRVTVHGREELTFSESARDAFVLSILQGDTSLTNRDFVNLVWFPTANSPVSNPQHPPLPKTDAFSKLNDSQKEVAAAMISSAQPIVIAHGPPGTGKTSTIAAAADYWISEAYPTYIIAQSNVGVKNIARSFVDKGVTDFKIIVSKEFYVEWHEHLYREIEHNRIQTDELSGLKDVYATERLVSDSSVILCTLSTLSNPVLDQCRLFDILPMVNLVVDEASQINVFEYMHLFHKFKGLKKVCFFGDPKQLPPFGRDAVSQLRSIFDVKHLKSGAYFLDTQYRMPVPLGEFISEKVYDSRLKTIHKSRDSSSVAFIDVPKGAETKDGKSWKNIEEARIVVKLVEDRYRHTDYCVITPYDAQRATIMKALKDANLPNDRVFNVDSFQGHEADYVIVSVTRTTSPGFLRTQSRTNVMLTRCKAGMIIVSNSFFVSHYAERTLLGKLVAHWEGPLRRTKVWIDWRQVVEGSVDLPGSRATKRRPPQRMPASAQSGSSPTTKPEYSRPTLNPPTPTLTSSSSSLQSLPEQMSGLHVRSQPSGLGSRRLTPRRVDDPDWPEIANLDPPASQPRLQGRWKEGSKLVR